MAEDGAFDDGQANVDQGTSRQSEGATDSFFHLVPASRRVPCVLARVVCAAAGASERLVLAGRVCLSVCRGLRSISPSPSPSAHTPLQPHLPLYHYYHRAVSYQSLFHHTSSFLSSHSLGTAIITVCTTRPRPPLPGLPTALCDRPAPSLDFNHHRTAFQPSHPTEPIQPPPTLDSTYDQGRRRLFHHRTSHRSAVCVA